MASDSLTPFLGLTKPIVGDEAGEDLWGEKLNRNFDLLDTFAASQGVLVEAPIDGAPYARASASWVETITKTTYDSGLTAQDSRDDDQDAAIAGKEPTIATGNPAYFWAGDKTWKQVAWSGLAGVPSTFPPTLPIPSSGVTGLDAAQANQDSLIAANTTALAGKEPTIAAGNATQFWRGDKTWQPLSSITVDAWTKAEADAKFVDVAGDTMTGALTLIPSVTGGNQATTKNYVDNAIATREPIILPGTTAQYWRGDKSWATFPPQIGLVSVSDTPPASPLDNQLFWESDTGRLFIRYNDGNSAQWVQTNVAGISDAPQDGGEYVRVNNIWRKVRQYLDLGGQTQLDVTVPSGAKRVKWVMDMTPAAAGISLGMRPSFDGTTFDTTTNNMGWVGFVRYSGTGTSIAAQASQGLGYIPLNYGSLDPTGAITMHSEGHVMLTRPAVGVTAGGQFHSESWLVASSQLYTDAIMRLWWQHASGLQMQALRFLTVGGNACGAGSSLELEWGY